MTEKALPTLAARTLTRAGIIAGSVLLLVLVGGTTSRLVASRALSAETEAATVPTVNVFHPTAAAQGTLVLPGRIQAWQQAPVYARTSGYVRRWYADIGTPVHAGQVLADIDAPDLDQQLAASNAALATATANRALAQITATRWDALLAQNAVARQDDDEKRSDFAAKQAAENQARANMDQLRAEVGFKHLVAPFDGVVTSRSTDVGALVVASDANAVAPLFTVSDTSRLRIYVAVPENAASAIQSVSTAQFTVPDMPDRVFTATLTHSADAVDAQSGAMLVQFVVDNHGGSLKPGGYAEVSLDLSSSAARTTVRIPASALLFRREGTAVAVVDREGHVTIRSVRIAQDFGATLEIAAGLTGSDWVVDSPSDSIATGEVVKPVAIAARQL
jgi:RND family efflux transporter MFP subunit